MNRAIRITVSTFGVLAGLIGIPHGFFEIQQGNTATGGLWIDAIGPANTLWHGGPAPALTVVPNFLATGILAVIASFVVILWAAVFIEQKHGGLVLFLLSLIQFLTGGGVAQMMLVVIVCPLATQINAPLTWWRAHFPNNARHFLAKLWPWFFIAGSLLYFLHYMVPFIIGITGSFLGDSDPRLGLIFGYAAIAPFVIAISTGFASDSLDQTIP